MKRAGAPNHQLGQQELHQAGGNQAAPLYEPSDFIKLFLGQTLAHASLRLETNDCNPATANTVITGRRSQDQGR